MLPGAPANGCRLYWPAHPAETATTPPHASALICVSTGARNRVVRLATPAAAVHSGPGKLEGGCECSAAASVDAAPGLVSPKRRAAALSRACNAPRKAFGPHIFAAPDVTAWHPSRRRRFCPRKPHATNAHRRTHGNYRAVIEATSSQTSHMGRGRSAAAYWQYAKHGALRPAPGGAPQRTSPDGVNSLCAGVKQLEAATRPLAWDRGTPNAAHNWARAA